jgi:phosphate-selective porin
MKMKQLFVVSIITLFFPVLLYSQGCMTPSSSSGGPQIIGYFQPEYNYTWLGDDANGENKDKSDFYFRRARLGITGNIPYDFSYYVLAELNNFNKGAYLLDAFVSYNRYKPYFVASMGQFKVPFGLELSTPCHSLHTIDRSRVVNELASPFRDMGIFFTGGTGQKKFFGLEKENLITYSLAITNGTGMNVIDNNASKDIIGRLVLAPFDWISFGSSYHTGKQKNPDVTVTKPDVKSRWGMDLELKKWNFTLQTEYIDGTDEGSKSIGGGCGGTPTVIPGTFYSNGYYMQLLYMTKWKVQPVLKYESYDPDTKVDDTNGSSYRHNTITGGVNIFPNDWTRIQINYLHNTELSNSVNKNEIENDGLYMQIQVKFN